MAIPNRNSRKIFVGNETYRWIVSPKDEYIVLVVEHDEFKGRRIEIFIHSDIHKFWVEFPNVEELNLKIIKPKDVELIISQAIKEGWNPKDKGSTIVFCLSEKTLLLRRNL
ncbi:hypothetical protein [Clostridium sp.]|uniref:hypothetical protein n=1 Tax=Clostridium sp. TaxID=1506 RepID=UPI00284FEB79|nr:hypothetical protein [Clostridium sp.]MDR3598046.1 hypothetical protein [Clostridium sp.]